MIRILFALLLFPGFHSVLFSQNLDDDYTENDFRKRNARKLTVMYTGVDTVTGLQKKPRITFIATFNPENRIITIRDMDPGDEQYFLTDDLDILYKVEKNGREDTTDYTQCHDRKVNDTTIAGCENMIRYNRKGQVLKMMTDTSNRKVRIYRETNFFYSGDTLKKEVYKRFVFGPGLSYRQVMEEPEAVMEAVYTGDIKTETFTERTGASKELRTHQVITEIKPKVITSKTYYHNKLTGIEQHIFE